MIFELKNMGSGSEILHMIFIFILILFPNYQLFLADASLNAAENTDDRGIQELYWVNSGDGRENQIKKVSGKDEEKKVLILEKFRVLLGLKSFNIRTPSNRNVEDAFLSPSPAPTIEAEAPAPVPELHIHVHSRPPSHRSSPIPPPHKIQRRNGDKARVRRILIAVIVSVGATCAICALGLILVCQKHGRARHKRSDKGSRGRSKYANTQNSAGKVSFEPGPDLFYLNSLGLDLEPQAYGLKNTCETVNIPPLDQNPLNSPSYEGSGSGQEQLKSEYENFSCPSNEEILSVHEDVELMKCERESANSSLGDKIPPLESYSSDDESFHSFCDSHSSNPRLSNASEGNVSDPSEIFSPILSQRSPPPCSTSPHSPCKPKQIALTAPCSSNSQQDFPAPPPPPPPPPLGHFSPWHSSSCSLRITSKVSHYSTMPHVSSPQNSDPFSGSNQTPPHDLPSSPPRPSPTPLGGARSIPPPPCPPPFLKGGSNSLKPPPPPPSQLPQFTPLGKDGAPLPKLKPLHWDKVRAASDRSMVWDKLRSSSFEFDEEMIESLFGYNLKSSIKNDEAKSKSPSPSKHVLDPKRLQNITILSKALNVTAEQVCNALMQGDGLCLQQLEALVKMVPTKEEEANLSNYKGDINELGSAEKFVKAMLSIPFAFLRIEAMLYRDTFEDEVVHLRKSFAMLEEACKELRSSRLFLKLLEAVLKTGNRMNVGTIRGGARAFKLDALLKLADVKGTDGKTTLLHFVVQEMIRSEGLREEIVIGKRDKKIMSETVEETDEDYRKKSLDHVSGLCTELCNVKKTATIDLDVLESSVSNLSDGMAKLQHLIGKDLSMDEQSGKFVHSMKSFLNYAKKSINELKEDEDRVLLHVREITEYFHGNVSKDEANPLRIFVIVRDFLGMLDQVCKELRSLKIPSIQILSLRPVDKITL
ncbi:hypothetical protein HHK36_022947 [Tetracentron sinense]|uniref:Formin-like protein n=1 Tax=Tetracentron sinense TaxID=13715 RepID=A0A834YVT9_TETSI|nr:hypothetical protein HHK36_022947 [Tetracentron sinense]